MEQIFEGLLLITIINILFHFYHVYLNTILILFISSYAALHTNIDSSQHLRLYFMIREHILYIMD